MKKDNIMMSRKELRRLPVIHKIMEKRLTQVRAATMLDLSDRQIRRIIHKITREGDAAVIHGNRGKESPFKMDKAYETKIMDIVEEKYYDFGPTFASEKLLELEKIKIGREKLRQVMISHGVWHCRKKKGSIHQWRERKHHYGEMIQMDGSDHAWLEDRGPRMALMGYIDDATGKIYGRFYANEGTFSAMDSFKRYIAKHGLPFSLYVDRHSTYKTSRQPNLDEDLKNEFAKTQFARALNEVEVKVIFAKSPQAKGRVERSFETLQDRLVKELRLAGISSMNEANAFLDIYLQKHNSRFAVKPFKKSNLHRPIPKNLDLDDIFCIKEYRNIGNGYTCQWKNRTFLIKSPSITMRKQRVTIMEHFDGKILLKLKNKFLDFVEITEKDIKALARDRKAAQKLIRKASVYFRPPKNHPWRGFTLGNKIPAFA